MCVVRLQDCKKKFKPYFQNIISTKNTSTKTLLTLYVFLEGEYLCMLIKLGLMKCLKHNKTGTCMHTSQYNVTMQHSTDSCFACCFAGSHTTASMPPLCGGPTTHPIRQKKQYLNGKFPRKLRQSWTTPNSVIFVIKGLRLRDTRRAHLRVQFYTGKNTWIPLVCETNLSQVNKPQ